MYKIVIAGCGSISNTWLTALAERDDCVIAGLADIVEAHALEKKEKFGLSANVYTSLGAAIGAEKPDIVLDLTPPDVHHEIVTAALRAGCHVFGEKPMSDSLEKAEDMVKCAESSGREYFVMQNYRYNPHIQALRDFIASGRPGKVGHISANFQRGPHFGGFREEMDSPLIADMAIHTFDAARFITGSSPEAVYCHEYNPVWSWYRGDASAMCIFEIESGLKFDYRGSWCVKGLLTHWNSEWRVACENGSIIWDGADRFVYQTEEGEVEEIPAKQMDAHTHAACIDEMLSALKAGKRAPTDCRDNINSVRMVYKAIESSAKKERILI